MHQRIIFQLEGQPVSVLIPCDCGLPIERIGQKDVPTGVPFWIVGVDAIPDDRTFRDAWEIDVSALGEPSGHGDLSAFETWRSEQEDAA